MKKNENHGYFIKSISIVLLSLIAVILIIAIFLKIDEYKRKSYKIDVKFSDNDIVYLTNKLPISDEIGKNYNGTGVEKGIADYKEFTITNPNERKVSYEIYLTKVTNKVDDIRSSYVKLYLTDENNNPVEDFGSSKMLSYYDLPSLEDKLDSRLLYRGAIVSGGSKKFKLRSWIADTYIISNTEEDFNFDIDVRLK